MLTSEQIRLLFSFCEKHYVRHYDVQVELVDHMANAIEEKMVADKNLSFETALEQVYAGFGIMGFSQALKSRTQMLTGKYKRMRKKLFLSYFTWPKVAQTVCVLAAILFIGRFLQPKEMYYAINGLMITVCVFEAYVSFGMMRAIKKETTKLLVTQSVCEQSWLGGLVGFAFIGGFNYTERTAGAAYIEYIVMIILLGMLFIATLAYRQIGKTTMQQARLDYPQVFATAQ